MDHKKIETDETLQQKFGYPAKGIPIPRICNTLNNFSNGKVNFHWHTEFQFGLVLKGQVDYWFYENPVSKVHHVLNAGDGFFINSKTLHEYRQIVPGTEVFIFSVSAGFFASSPAFGTIYQDMVLPVLRSGVPGLFLLESSSQDAYLLKLFRQFQALDPESSDYELYSMELICRLWRILYHRIGLPEKNVSLSKATPFQAKRMSRMLDYIHQHYSEPIMVEQIARAGKISKRECFRCFRAFLSQSPGEYLNQYHLSQAAFMLTHTTYSLSRICEQCGFNNVSYFGKLFRRQYGVPPGHFRQLSQ